MNGSLDFVISGVGAVTPVGLDAPASCAALRAGIARMLELESGTVDSQLLEKQPAIGGRVPLEWFEGGPTEPEWPGHERFELPEPPPPEAYVEEGVERLARLAGPAASEAWRNAKLEGQKGDGIGLYLGLGEDEDAGPVVDNIIRAIGSRLSPVVVRSEGRAAGLVALDSAIGDLSAGRIRGALVGGVDSLIRAPVLERLESAGRLQSGTNPHGVIPGEAAAFLFVESKQQAQSRGASAAVRIVGSSTAEEPTVDTDEPNQAAGLTKVLQATCKDRPEMQVMPLVVCDLNGDRYRGMEWGLATARTFRRFHEAREIWHPADCIGDCGAASGTLNAVWACGAFERGYAMRDHAVVWGASDGKARAALLLAPLATG